MTLVTSHPEYQLVRGWEKLPRGRSHPDVAGVAIDDADNVYLLCRGADPVMVYDKDGNFLHAWGRAEFSYRVHGISYSGNDRLLIADDDGNRIGEYSTSGEFIRNIGPTGPPSDTGFNREAGSYRAACDTVVRSGGPYNRPTKAVASPDGHIYVADGYGNARIHHFDSDGKLLKSWGTPGEAPGQFRTPHGLCLSNDGQILVADRENDRIQIFDRSGGFVEQWTDVQRPTDVAADARGYVYVAEIPWTPGDYSYTNGEISEYKPGRLSVFDSSGNLVSRLSSDHPERDGYFAAPHGICVDSEGSIYIAEATDTFSISRGLAEPGAQTFQKFVRI